MKTSILKLPSIISERVSAESFTERLSESQSINDKIKLPNIFTREKNYTNANYENLLSILNNLASEKLQ